MTVTTASKSDSRSTSCWQFKATLVFIAALKGNNTEVQIALGSHLLARDTYQSFTDYTERHVQLTIAHTLLTGVPVNLFTVDHTLWNGTPPSRAKDHSILHTHTMNA